MRIAQTKVYKFEELSEEIQEKVLTDFYNIDVGWWDCIYADAKDIGLKITEFDLDRNRYAKGEFLDYPSNVAEKIIKDPGEKCETYKTAMAFLEEVKEIFSDKDAEEEFLRSILEDYSIMLQKEFEYLTSEEAIKEIIKIKEMIKINEYDFTKDGILF